jgi:hypothetical protein
MFPRTGVVCWHRSCAGPWKEGDSVPRPSQNLRPFTLTHSAEGAEKTATRKPPSIDHLFRFLHRALILIVTADPSTQLEKEAQGVGIKGFCPKNDIRCLLNAVEAVLGGGTYFSEEAVT